MVVAGLDPGTERSALVTWNGTQVLRYIEDTNVVIKQLLAHVPICDVLVIEEIQSYGMAVGREVFQTVKWSGRFAEAWESADFNTLVDGRRTVEELPRRAVKLHLCHSNRATDSNIRQALIDRIGPIGTKKEQGPLYGLKGHHFAALAVAVTWLDEQEIANANRSRTTSF